MRKALPISEKPKLAWLEFRYFGIILKLALLEFRYFGIISKLALLAFRYFDIILKLAWFEFQYFGIQKITENNFSISVYRYSNIYISNPGHFHETVFVALNIFAKNCFCWIKHFG